MTTPAATEKTFCRYCHAYCPMEADIDASGRVTAVRPDTDNAMYGGYTCIKGRQLVEQMYQPERLTRTLKKRAPNGPGGTPEKQPPSEPGGTPKQQPHDKPGGTPKQQPHDKPGGTQHTHTEISSQQALDEIAERLRAIIDQHGPRAVATYNGTYAFQNSAQLAFSRAWHNALGSPSYYTSVTIDQPAKVFVSTRHGFWGAGGHFYNDSDVTLVLGNNPMVSQYAPPGGVPSVSPFEKLREAKKRGQKLIAVDPRITELSRRADLHLQIRPGEDSTLLAAMIRLIIAEGLHDADFCRAHTEGLDALREAVEPYTLDYAARRTGLAAGDIERAARLFAAGPRGVAISGTGPEMSPHPNLTHHLIMSLNSLCGRYYREGDTLPNPGVLSAPSPRRAQVLPIPLAWGQGAPSRIKPDLGELTAMGMMGPVREMPTNLLSDEILTPGDGQVRALIVVGGNPLLAFPNQEKTHRALQSLDLLVCIDAYMSESARMADYVFAPKLTLEREDVTLLADPWYEEPYSQYSKAVVATDSDMDVIEEWEVYWELGRRLGLQVNIGKTPIDMARRPAKFEVLQAITAGSRVPVEWLRDNPGGHSFPEQKAVVEAGDPDGPRLQFFPVGVAEEFAAALAEPAVDARFDLRLISSRSKYVLNSSGLNLSLLRRKMGTTNPLLMHPDDIRARNLEEDCLVEVHSQHGSILGVVRAYDRIRPGVVTMHHSWGVAPDSADAGKVREVGANTNRLIDNLHNTQAFTGMTQQSAIPVYLQRVESSAA